MGRKIGFFHYLQLPHQRYVVCMYNIPYASINNFPLLTHLHFMIAKRTSNHSCHRRNTLILIGLKGFISKGGMSDVIDLIVYLNASLAFVFLTISVLRMVISIFLTNWDTCRAVDMHWPTLRVKGQFSELAKTITTHFQGSKRR